MPKKVAKKALKKEKPDVKDEEALVEKKDSADEKKAAIVVGKNFRLVPKKHGFTMYILNNSGKVYHMVYPSTVEDAIRSIHRYSKKLSIMDLRKDITFEEAAKRILKADEETRKLIKEVGGAFGF